MTTYSLCKTCFAWTLAELVFLRTMEPKINTFSGVRGCCDRPLGDSQADPGFLFFLLKGSWCFLLSPRTWQAADSQASYGNVLPVGIMNVTVKAGVGLKCMLLNFNLFYLSVFHVSGYETTMLSGHVRNLRCINEMHSCTKHNVWWCILFNLGKLF